VEHFIDIQNGFGDLLDAFAGFDSDFSQICRYRGVILVAIFLVGEGPPTGKMERESRRGRDFVRCLIGGLDQSHGTKFLWIRNAPDHTS